MIFIYIAKFKTVINAQKKSSPEFSQFKDNCFTVITTY